jgi:hypothetical protein
MKRQPFALPYAGIHQEADLSANHASAAPVEPAVGDYIADALGGLGVPREQALALGSAFGLVPQWSRDSGRAMALPFFEPTAGNIAGAGVEAALTAVPGAKGVKVAADAAEGAAKKAIKAYHGSPHDFDRFDMSKIGTGEGAQAYGHGLYFADNEEVAKSYRDQLSGNIGRSYPDEQSAMAAAGPGGMAMDTGDLGWYARGADGKWVTDHVPGKMYEVNINADPEHFLDWDKPLSQQSEKVRAALPEMKPHMTGGQVHESQRLVPGDYMDKAAAREQLLQRGIPGIRYLDQGSRWTGDPVDTIKQNLAKAERTLAEVKAEPNPRQSSIDYWQAEVNAHRGNLSEAQSKTNTSNYVVFDDKLVEILRKYGIALPFGLGAAGAGALGKGPDEPETY